MLDIRDVFSNLLSLFLLIGVGYGAVKWAILPPSSAKIFSGLLMKITLPATVFISLLRPYDPALLRDSLLIIGLGFFLHLSYGGLSWLLARLLHVPDGQRGTWMFCASFCNNGFMGFPIALALFGETGLTLAVFLGLSFNFLVYTLGARMICMDVSRPSGTPPIPWRSILLSPINAAMFLGLLFYILPLSLPNMVQAPIHYLANVTTPLSMLVTGINLGCSRVGDLFHDRHMFSCSLVRLLAFPLLTWCFLLLLPIPNPLVLGVVFVIMSMPAPAVACILSETYGGNVEFAAKIVFVSSLLCLITIPILSLLL